MISAKREAARSLTPSSCRASAESSISSTAADSSRETALVESGAVVLVCDGERHELAEGDCVTFDADLPHHFENPAGEPAVLLAVLSAGLRRS